MTLSVAMQGVQRLALETSPYIYYVENHPAYADKVDAVFKYVEDHNLEIYSAVITLTETLIPQTTRSTVDCRIS